MRKRGTAYVETSNGVLVVSVDGKTFSLPGGEPRKGESRKRATIRELKEETGLIATKCDYLFEYVSPFNRHKVFQIECVGESKPRHEIKHLDYFNGSNLKVSNTTREIIERVKRFSLNEIVCQYCGALTCVAPEYKCVHCGAPIKREGA